jgi:glycine cleavage system protein P-like pyridoxal-binding family
MLIGPTETDRLETLDAFADALPEIAREEIETPELIFETEVIPRIRHSAGSSLSRVRARVDLI